MQVYDGHNGHAAAHRVVLLMDFFIKQALAQGCDMPTALVCIFCFIACMKVLTMLNDVAFSDC